MSEDERVLAWVNRQLARRRLPLLARLPEGGAEAALPDIEFRPPWAYAYDANGQLASEPLPEVVNRHVRSLRLAP